MFLANSVWSSSMDTTCVPPTNPISKCNLRFCSQICHKHFFNLITTFHIFSAFQGFPVINILSTSKNQVGSNFIQSLTCNVLVKNVCRLKNEEDWLLLFLADTCVWPCNRLAKYLHNTPLLSTSDWDRLQQPIDKDRDLVGFKNVWVELCMWGFLNLIQLLYCFLGFHRALF